VGVSATTFDILVRDRTMPRPAKLRGRVLWDRRALDRALDGIFNASPEMLPADSMAAPEFAL
jgi:predicted DNA-binding transcriptional regulator AlpA